MKCKNKKNQKYDQCKILKFYGYVMLVKCYFIINIIYMQQKYHQVTLQRMTTTHFFLPNMYTLNI